MAVSAVTDKKYLSITYSEGTFQGKPMFSKKRYPVKENATDEAIHEVGEALSNLCVKPLESIGKETVETLTSV